MRVSTPGVIPNAGGAGNSILIVVGLVVLTAAFVVAKFYLGCRKR